MFSKSVRVAKALVFSVALVGVAACSSSHPHVATPTGFAEVKKDQEGYQHRVFNAHGVVVGVRKEKNTLHGGPSFWASALDQRFRRAGYKHRGAEDVKSVAGLVGRQLRYNQEQDGRTYRYWVTIFADNANVYIVEAGGDKEFFDPVEKDVAATIASLSTDG